jgi:hypothetical protein
VSLTGEVYPTLFPPSFLLEIGINERVRAKTKSPSSYSSISQRFQERSISVSLGLGKETKMQ